MRNLLPILFLTVLGAGCSGHGPKDAATSAPSSKVAALIENYGGKLQHDPHGWFIESYDREVFTIQHEGYIYLTKCRGSSIGYPNKVVKSPICDLAFRQVGHLVEPGVLSHLPPGGNQPDPLGATVQMWIAGNDLVLQAWWDKSTPDPVKGVGGVGAEWEQETFEIISIKKAGKP